MVHLRPGAGEYAHYYEKYVAMVGPGDPIQQLGDQGEDIRRVLAGISEEQAGFRYAPEKWTVRELVSHLSDSERVFAYRALRFGRGDATALPGFDQEAWGAQTNARARTLVELAAEFAAVRTSTVALFRGLPPEALALGGIASENHVTVRALLYIIIGHANHHLNILGERYLASPDFPR